MKKRIIALLLIVLVLFSFVACGKEKNATAVNVNLIKRQELGTSMPRMLFAHEGKIAFWGTFGLFILNGEDGSIYRSVDLERFGHNHVSGEIITRFLFSEDYGNIYIYNEGENEENINDYFLYYNIEEDVVRQIPVGETIAVLPPRPPLTMELAGGERSTGYTSNPVVYDENTVVYLYAKDWKVKDLTLCYYHVNDQSTTSVTIF